MWKNICEKIAALPLRRILTVLLLAVFLFAAAMLAIRSAENRENQRENAEAQQVAGLAETEDVSGQAEAAISTEDTAETEEKEEAPEEPEEEKVPAADLLPKEMAYLADIDVAALQEVNEDVVGWIEIPNTEISYPLMQGEDNDFYLNNTWQGEENSSGSIFIDYRCSADFNAFHTIIYGHRKRNGTMFGSLKYYKDDDYWQEHPSIWIVTDDAIYRYDIFAAWAAPIDSGVYSLYYPTRAKRAELLDMFISKSSISTGISPKMQDRILTLSTCTGQDYSARWVVHAVLTLKVMR